MFVPHSFLHYFPLHLLELSFTKDENKNEGIDKCVYTDLGIKTDCNNQVIPLIRTHIVSYLPSTSILQFYYPKKKNDIVDDEYGDINKTSSNTSNIVSPCNAFGVSNSENDSEFLREAEMVSKLLLWILLRKPH